MGYLFSTSEKQDVEDHAKSKEGESILEIANSLLEINIYVCGKDTDTFNFFEKNIIKDVRFPTKSNVKYYDKMAKHKEISDWHFFFATTVNSFDEMLENTIKFIDDHNSFEDFDDFDEGSKKRIGKNVIMYFIDENKDNFLNHFLKVYNHLELPLFIIVGNENENKQLNKSIINIIKEVEAKRPIDSNIFKFSNFSESYEKENNLINLYMNLIECSAFYNELGDEYKYPKQFLDDKLFDNVVKEIIKNFTTLNILVCGKPGSGKSTFINRMLHTTISKSQRGGECSKRIIRYIHRTLPITFYDTPGISTQAFMKEIIGLIDKKNIELGEIQSKIHAVFYLFDAQSTRYFMDYEEEMFNLLLQKYKIPLYFLGTRCQNNEEFQSNKIIIIKNYYNIIKNIDNLDINYQKEYIKDRLFCINLIGGGYSEVDKLFDKMFNDFKKYIREEKINNDNISDITGENCLISKLRKPEEIIPHPVKLCQNIKLTYRLIARSIGDQKKGSTLLSSSFLRIIYKIFCHEGENLSLQTCKQMIKSLDFNLDEENINNKGNYKSWFHDIRHGYKTKAEEQISLLANKYIAQYKEELKQNNENCLKYINILRVSLNASIKGLKKISDEFK